MLPAVAGCQPQLVAVKIRHPDVVQCLVADFKLLKMLARALESIPAVRGLGLSESVAQFSNTMTAQADMRVEAAHLERFCNSFACVDSKVRGDGRQGGRLELLSLQVRVMTHLHPFRFARHSRGWSSCARRCWWSPSRAA